MKLASLKGGRDGRLALVSSDLISATLVPEIAPTLQVALDAWDAVAPRLFTLSRDLNAGKIRDAFVFDPSDCESPLPRAFQWADGSAYVNHVELVRKARGAEMPQSFWTDPLMYQGGSDHFLGPTEAIAAADDGWGIDFEGEVAVITADVPTGCDAGRASGLIHLVMLANDVSLRNLIPQELAKGFGFFQSKPAGSFSPVAVTPDELGEAWRDGRLHRQAACQYEWKGIRHPGCGH